MIYTLAKIHKLTGEAYKAHVKYNLNRLSLDDKLSFIEYFNKEIDDNKNHIFLLEEVVKNHFPEYINILNTIMLLQ
jgi:hypothetical protein